MHESGVICDKTEQDKVLWRSGIDKAITEYQIEEEAFANRSQAVIDRTIDLFAEYEMDTGFVDLPERTLFALAIADGLLTNIDTKEEEEEAALHYILGLVSLWPDEDGNIHVFSTKIGDLNLRIMPAELELEFVEGESVYNYYRQRILAYCNMEATDNLCIDMKDYGDGSRMHIVRENLQVTQESEETVEIIVLKIDAEKCKFIFGFPAAQILAPNYKDQFIVLPSDYDQGLLEHEYTHSQSSVNFKPGLARLLFTALVEVLTENHVQHPRMYRSQTMVIERLFPNDQFDRDSLHDAYMGDNDAKAKFYREVISNYGLSGFLALARMSPSSDSNYLLGNGQSIYINPYDVEYKCRRTKNAGIKLDPDVLEALREKQWDRHMDSHMNNRY